jgi:AraC-like DNA-binding protein
MDLTFAPPSAFLSNHVTAYYLLHEPHALIEDRQRADVGQLRFFLEGSGHHNFGRGRRVDSSAAFLTGPTNESNGFFVTGPLRFVGVGLMPEAWGGMLRADAGALADDAVDAHAALERPPDILMDRLRLCASIAEMAPLLDAYLLPLVKPLPADHSAAIRTISAWLARDMFPDVADLYAAFDTSDRQVMRIANRYFGASPKTLSRKYGALKTASYIFTNGGALPDAALIHYADKSHLIREVKHFTGQTPRQLRTISSRIMRTTLSADNFRELMQPA